MRKYQMMEDISVKIVSHFHDAHSSTAILLPWSHGSHNMGETSSCSSSRDKDTRAEICSKAKWREQQWGNGWRAVIPNSGVSMSCSPIRKESNSSADACLTTVLCRWILKVYLWLKSQSLQYLTFAVVVIIFMLSIWLQGGARLKKVETKVGGTSDTASSSSKGNSLFAELAVSTTNFLLSPFISVSVWVPCSVLTICLCDKPVFYRYQCHCVFNRMPSTIKKVKTYRNL
jgi:hypothetical protein